MDELEEIPGSRAHPEFRFDINAILLSVIISLSLSPVTLSLFSYETRFIDNLEKLFIISASITFIYITYKIVQLSHYKSQVNEANDVSALQGYSRGRFRKIFGSVSYQNSPQKDALPRQAARSSWVDSRYYRPRYVAQEMRTMWNLTYTVVSWGSVMLIGGTISAGEKLFQRTRSKFPASPPKDIQSPPDHKKSKRNGKISSWTKKSVSYLSKRMGKPANSMEKETLVFDGNGNETSASYVPEEQRSWRSGVSHVVDSGPDGS